MKLCDFHALELPQSDLVDRPKRTHEKVKNKTANKQIKAYKQRMRQLEEDDEREDWR